jgi:hypothetical protein
VIIDATTNRRLLMRATCVSIRAPAHTSSGELEVVVFMANCIMRASPDVVVISPALTLPTVTFGIAPVHLFEEVEGLR